MYLPAFPKALHSSTESVSSTSNAAKMKAGLKSQYYLGQFDAADANISMLQQQNAV